MVIGLGDETYERKERVPGPNDVGLVRRLEHWDAPTERNREWERYNEELARVEERNKEAEARAERLGLKPHYTEKRESPELAQQLQERADIPPTSIYLTKDADIHKVLRRDLDFVRNPHGPIPEVLRTNIDGVPRLISRNAEMPKPIDHPEEVFKCKPCNAFFKDPSDVEHHWLESHRKEMPASLLSISKISAYGYNYVDIESIIDNGNVYKVKPFTQSNWYRPHWILYRMGGKLVDAYNFQIYAEYYYVKLDTEYFIKICRRCGQEFIATVPSYAYSGYIEHISKHGIEVPKKYMDLLRR